MRWDLVKTLHWMLIARDDMMSHLKDCLVESPSLAGNADGENEVEGVKVKNTKNTTWGNFCKAQKRQTCKNMTPGENHQGTKIICLLARNGSGYQNNEFSEKFQTAFDLPPHFQKIMSHVLGKHPNKTLYEGPKSAPWIFRLKMTTPLFRKFICFGTLTCP